MQNETVSSAGKHVTGAKRGKTCNRCQARESIQPVLSAGKHVTGLGKRGERCKYWSQTVQSARKQGTALRAFSFFFFCFFVFSFSLSESLG